MVMSKLQTLQLVTICMNAYLTRDSDCFPLLLEPQQLLHCNVVI